MRTFKMLVLFAVVALLGACTTLSVSQQIMVADQAVTTVVTNADQSLKLGLITPAQASSVSTIAHQVNPLLDTARAAVDAADIPGATRTMQLVNALLAGLQNYIPTVPAGVTP